MKQRTNEQETRSENENIFHFQQRLIVRNLDFRIDLNNAGVKLRLGPSQGLGIYRRVEFKEHSTNTLSIWESTYLQQDKRK